MKIPEPTVVQGPGGTVVWHKEKGPEHIVSEYWIYCWLGPNAFTSHKELFDRIRGCGFQLGSLAIICRSYATKRDRIQHFHEEYLLGSVAIPFDKWNAHILSLEEAVVDIEAFYWFSNRLLTRIALTLNYFFKKVARPKVSITGGVHSHSSLVKSSLFTLLPANIQKMAGELNVEVAEFRNEHIEHDMDYWRGRKTEFVSPQPGAPPQVGVTLPSSSPKIFPERPLRELWISLHDYVTEVAKFLGLQIK